MWATCSRVYGWRDEAIAAAEAYHGADYRAGAVRVERTVYGWELQRWVEVR